MCVCPVRPAPDAFMMSVPAPVMLTGLEPDVAEKPLPHVQIEPDATSIVELKIPIDTGRTLVVLRPRLRIVPPLTTIGLAPLPRLKSLMKASTPPATVTVPVKGLDVASEIWSSPEPDLPRPPDPVSRVFRCVVSTVLQVT